MLSFFKNKIIESVRSSLGYKLEVKQNNGKYILDTGHVNYSFGGLHSVFADAFKKTEIEKRSVKNVLILGFGAGSVADILVETYRKNCSITGVEVDEAVLDLAHKYFNLDKYKKLKIVQQDAREFVRNDQQLYDLVIVDVYEDFKVPEFALKKDFLKNVEKRMEAGALLYFNKIIYNIESEVSATRLKANLIDTFATVREFRMKYAVSNTMFVCEKI